MEEIEVGEEEVGYSVGLFCNEMSAIVSTFFHHLFFLYVSFRFCFLFYFLTKTSTKIYYLLRHPCL
jgi:hypothetical protein